MIPISFPNKHINLAGDLFLPERKGPFPVLVVLHSASNGRKDDPCYKHLVDLLPSNDIAVFLYDRRGEGNSEGNYETASFDDLADDAVSAIHAVIQFPQICPDRVVLYGISQGGWIAPMAAKKSTKVCALVIISGCAVSPSAQMSYAARWTMQEEMFAAEEIDTALYLRTMVDEYYRGRITHEEVAAKLRIFRNESWYTSAYLPDPAELPGDVKTTKWYYEFDYEPLAVWSQVHLPTMFMYAESDRWVPVEKSINLFSKHTTHMADVSFQRIPGTNHMMEINYSGGGKSDVSKEYQNLLVEWLEKRIK